MTDVATTTRSPERGFHGKILANPKERDSMLQRWLLIWLCALCALAYAWPSALLDPFAETRVWLKQLFVIPMFALGWLLPRDEVNQVVRRWPLVLGGTTIQYLTMPLLSFVIAHTLPVSEDARLGIIMVGCVPGAMASNVLTLIARANASYSLSLTTAATCLSPLAVPLLLKFLLGEALPVPTARLIQNLAWMVLLPVVVGHWMGRRAGHWKPHVDTVAREVAALSIMWIIAIVVNANRDRFDGSMFVVAAAVLTLNVAGYLAGYGGSRLLRLDPGMRRALILEIGMQNAGLGTTLVQDLFRDRPAALVPTALYTFGCMLTGTLLARLWSSRGASGSQTPRAYDS